MPRGSRIRPATGLVRETVMNLFTSDRIRSGPFIDLCAGTGLVGLEAISRGAPRALFVEADTATAKRLRTTISSWDLDSRCTVLKLDVRRCFKTVQRLLAAERAACAFLDPPYIQGLAGDALERVARHASVLHHEGMLIVRTPEALEERPANLCLLTRRSCGNAFLWVYTPSSATTDGPAAGIQGGA
jgi:16S rRNA (guanine966-N2)-methyltransferase